MTYDIMTYYVISHDYVEFRTGYIHYESVNRANVRANAMDLNP